MRVEGHGARPRDLVPRWVRGFGEDRGERDEGFVLVSRADGEARLCRVSRRLAEKVGR